MTRETAGKRAGGVSEEPDGAKIFSAVFAVSLRFCSKSSLTFNKQMQFFLSLFRVWNTISHLSLTHQLLQSRESFLLLLLHSWGPQSVITRLCWQRVTCPWLSIPIASQGPAEWATWTPALHWKANTTIPLSWETLDVIWKKGWRLEVTSLKSQSCLSHKTSIRTLLPHLLMPPLQLLYI